MESHGSDLTLLCMRSTVLSMWRNSRGNMLNRVLYVPCSTIGILQSKILTRGHCTGRSENMEFVYFFMLHLLRHKKERSLLKFCSKKLCSKTWHTFWSFKIIKNISGIILRLVRRYWGVGKESRWVAVIQWANLEYRAV